MADRAQMLKDIQEVSFRLDDLTLYLDTHPLDSEALDSFNQAREERYQKMQTYSQEFEPLNLYLTNPDTNNETDSYSKYPGQRHFTWSDGPLPWDDQGGI